MGVKQPSVSALLLGHRCPPTVLRHVACQDGVGPRIRFLEVLEPREYEVEAVMKRR